MNLREMSNVPIGITKVSKRMVHFGISRVKTPKNSNIPIFGGKQKDDHQGHIQKFFEEGFQFFLYGRKNFK